MWGGEFTHGERRCMYSDPLVNTNYLLLIPAAVYIRNGMYLQVVQTMTLCHVFM